MKNKKYLVSLFVLVALLCLGIGYAAISETLRISGGVQTGDADDLNENFIVYFSKVDVDTTLAEGATVTTDLDPAAKTTMTSFSIKNMNKVGSEVVLTYTVKNDSVDLYANSPTIYIKTDKVEADEVYFLGSYFTISITPIMVKGQAAPQSTHTITIVVEMTKTPLDKEDYDFELAFVYQAAHKDGN